VTQEFKVDPRNENILISINGELYPRAKAMVSVFDSGFVLGDGVWEGLRVHGGGVAFLREHIERLYEGAKSILMDTGLAPNELVEQIFACLDANKMTDGVHVRLMVTRGVKATPYQDPRATISPPTIVIIPEWKTPKPEVVAKGLTLHTVNVRRGAPDVQDQKLNSHSKLNCITACVQAMNAGADEAFVTGTFAGLVPVREIDGRCVAHPLAPKGDWPGIGPMTAKLTDLYKALAKREAKRSL
jgi:branched-chain amino acid aminotransferase